MEGSLDDSAGPLISWYKRQSIVKGEYMEALQHCCVDRSPALVRQTLFAT